MVGGYAHQEESRVISETRARELARQYLESNPIPSTDYEWVVKEPRRGENGWVFSYSYRCKKDIPRRDQEQFGGAPAFLVGDDESVRDLSWEDLG